MEGSRLLTVWLGGKSHRSESGGPGGVYVISIVLLNSMVCG